MKTFAKTLLAAGVGVFGICGAANAATPYGSLTSYGSLTPYGSQIPYGSQMPYDFLSSTRNIAVGGCYQNGDSCCDTYDCCVGSVCQQGSSCDDSVYRPLPARSVYETRPDFHTLPYPAPVGSDCTWNANARDRRRYNDFDVNLQSRWSNPSSTFHDRDYGRYDNQRFDDRYDGSPSFEPWRPMNVSNTSHRW